MNIAKHIEKTKWLYGGLNMNNKVIKIWDYKKCQTVKNGFIKRFLSLAFLLFLSLFNKFSTHKQPTWPIIYNVVRSRALVKKSDERVLFLLECA